MSLSAKREYLAKIHGRYQRAGRPHKSRILDEFCVNCGYHRKAALRLLHRPLASGRPKRSGPKPIYEPAEVLPVLKAVWLASDQLCSKLLRAALPEWVEHYERRFAPLPASLRKKLLAISPAQIDRLPRPVRVRHPRKGLSAMCRQRSCTAVSLAARLYKCFSSGNGNHFFSNAKGSPTAQ